MRTVGGTFRRCLEIAGVLFGPTANVIRQLKPASYSWILVVFLFVLPAVVKAHFTYVTNSDGATLTITGYSGPGGDVNIPGTISIDGVAFPVTGIGQGAFENCNSLTSVEIPDSVSAIGPWAFSWCTGLTNATLDNSVTGDFEFESCYNLTSVTIGTKVTSIRLGAFSFCFDLANVTIPDSVTSIGAQAFYWCTAGLSNVVIPDGTTIIGNEAFEYCGLLSSITIPGSVTNIGSDEFDYCGNLTNVLFTGNAPGVFLLPIFNYDNNVTVYYLAGASGWGRTFAGAPTVMLHWTPTILEPPLSQTAETGSTVDLTPQVINYLPVTFQWYCNGTNLVSEATTNCDLELTNVQFSQSGAYTVVVANDFNAATSAPAFLNVIPVVERRPVPAIKLMAPLGSLLGLDYRDSFGPTAAWSPLATLTVITGSQYYFDLTTPLPAQRYYRAWLIGIPGLVPALNLNLVPAITLTGNVGDSLELDCINQFGPTNSWVTLHTVKLTNTSEFYFDVSAIGQPPRLWRIVPVP